ncbi:glycosyltransferase family 2 protein [Aliihoeflea sp. PC F10.4]
MNQPSICVIIAAYNSGATIATAIRSALREPEVSEVIVIDDASGDDTAEVARQSDDGTRRLVVRRLDENRGPAHARNAAIDLSSAPYIAILDADDVFLPGRFANLLTHQGWDLAADNIVFVPEENAAGLDRLTVPEFPPEPEFVEPARFIDGNISRRGNHRGEMGFLKPVMKRAFLDTHNLRYDETLRLGEDYALYVRAMAAGARFLTIKSCGYGAVVRGDSLSGRHRTDDLEALARSDLDLLRDKGLKPELRRALTRHERHIRAKYHLRRFLDVKANAGAAAAFAYAFNSPERFFPIAQGVGRDKWAALSRRLMKTKSHRERPQLRFLLNSTGIMERN